MSREQQTTELINNLGNVNATEVLLSDTAISLAQIADKIGCDYEERKEFVADNDKQASLVTVYHRRENK